MQPSFDEILQSSMRHSYVDDVCCFVCQFTPIENTYIELSTADLSEIHKDLPSAARHFAKRNDVIGVLSLIQTLDYWRNPEHSVLVLGGKKRISKPYRVEQASYSPGCLRINAATYTLLTLPDGVVVADNYIVGVDFLPYKSWFDENYPGSFEKVQALFAIGGYTPEEVADMAFSKGPTVANAVSLIDVSFT